VLMGALNCTCSGDKIVTLKTKEWQHISSYAGFGA